MATAKTPKTAPVKAAAVKPAAAVKAAAVKPAVAKAAAIEKPAEEAITKPVEIAAEAVEAAPKVIETVAEPVLAAIPEPVKEPVKKVAASVAVAAKGTEEKLRSGVETFLEFGRDNAILLVSAGNDFALGFHKLSLSLIDWSAESCDKSVAGASALMSAKTVEEVIGLSQSLAQDGIQQLLKEGSELGSLSSKLVEETLVPLPGRLVAAVEKLAAHAA